MAAPTPSPSSPILEPGDNLLLYGTTGSGKSTQVGEIIRALATPEHPVRVYTTDKGGIAPYLPLVRRGLVQLEVYEPSQDRLVWIDNVCQGKVYRDGKWEGNVDGLSAVVFESLSGCADLMLNALGQQAAGGNNVGGEPAPALKIQAQGQTILVPSSSRTHYLVTQRWLMEKVWQSQTLPVPVIWTAHEDIATLDKKTADGEKQVEMAAGVGVRGIIGPMVIGSALTKEMPKYFVYTFRLSTIATEQKKRHVMFTGRHRDGQLEGLANGRTTLNSAVPLQVEPTDVPGTLRKIKEEWSKA